MVRLAFQVFLTPNPKDKSTLRPIPAIISDPIFDTKSHSDLVIFDISDHTSQASGGKKIMIFCEKVIKTDIAIRFYEEGTNGDIVWEAFGKFKPNNVHRQLGISFWTPAYRTNNLTEPIEVYMQLQRPSDKATGEPLPFQYIPGNVSPLYILLFLWYFFFIFRLFFRFFSTINK